MEKFIVETSARHIHVTKQQVEVLFGENYKLTLKKIYRNQVNFFAKKN